MKAIDEQLSLPLSRSGSGLPPCRFGPHLLRLELLLGAALPLGNFRLRNRSCLRSLRLAIASLARSPPSSGKPSTCIFLSGSTTLNFLSTSWLFSRRLSQRIRILSLQNCSLMPHPGSPRANILRFGTIKVFLNMALSIWFFDTLWALSPNYSFLKKGALLHTRLPPQKRLTSVFLRINPHIVKAFSSVKTVWEKFSPK